MRAYIQLTLAQLRIFWRNKHVIFWTLFFPLVLMIALGSFLGNGNGISIDVALVDEDNSPTSISIIESFMETEGMKSEVFQLEEEALESLDIGNHQLVVVLPDGLENKVLEEEPLSVPVYYNEMNMAASELGLFVVNQKIDEISKEARGYEPILSVEAVGVEALELRYIDFLVPGLVALMIMSNNLNGVAGQISTWRERGILRRMQGTRLKARTFIAAQITARLVLNGTQAMIVLLVAKLIFGINIAGSWLALIAFVILGTLAFMSIGFIVASLASPETASPIAGFISFPMIFLGGVFFPIRDMPEVLQPIVSFLPISHLSNALREIVNLGTPFIALLPHFLILLGWLVGAFIIASWSFKWE